jgi:RNA polymerase sigma-70 factor (ECF subfamily)
LDDNRTTIAVQRYLDGMSDDPNHEAAVRALLDRAARRLHKLCASLLHRSYPRLMRPPLNLQPDEMLSAVVERMLKALRSARPKDVRQFFALAGQHMRWELNDLARRLDNQPTSLELNEELTPAAAESNTGLSSESRRIFEAIERLPKEQREAFDLVQIQGMSYSEAAEILGVSAITVKRRANRTIQLLAEQLSDLRPDENPSG